MRRRAFLAGIAGASACATTAGCLGVTGASRADLGLDDGPVLSVGKWTKHEGVRIRAESIQAFDSIEYTDTDAGEIRTFEEDDTKIVVVEFRAENLTDDEKEYPAWDNFRLQTPEEEAVPRTMIAGVSVEQIRDPVVVWPTSSGIRADYSRGWHAVFLPDAAPKYNYAVAWNGPGGPVYWRPE